MKKPDRVRCETCVYWVLQPSSGDGECHRSAPVAVTSRIDDAGCNDLLAWFPETTPTDWCGEWLDEWPEWLGTEPEPSAHSNGATNSARTEPDEGGGGRT